MTQNPIPAAPLRRPQSASVLAVGIVCVLVSLFLWYSLSAQERRATELEFSGRANNQQFILQSGIDDYWDGIFAVRALFDSSNHPIARDEFERFANSLLAGHPSILNIAWIPRVKREERIAHEQAGARDGLANYHIRAIAPDQSLPLSPERDEYFPKFYSTEDRQSQVYGLDLNDDGPRMQTLARIRDNDALSISPPLPLHISQEDRLGFWAALPVYAQGQPHDSVEDRRRNLRGFIQGVFQIRVMVDSIFSEVRAPVRFYLFAQDAGADDLPIYAVSRFNIGPVEPEPRTKLTAGTHRSFPVKFGDVQWTMVVTPEPAAINPAGYNLSSIVLTAGLLLGALLTLFIWALQRSNATLRQRTEELLREIEERRRTQAALQESEQVIEAVLDSVPARIFWKDKNLVYLGCNAAFARDAGFTRPDEVVGKDDNQLGWRDQANLYRSDDRKIIDSGLPKLLIDEPQTTPEGKVITLLTGKIPLRGPNGEITGVLGMYMDVTERARLQEQLAYSNLLNAAALEHAPDGILVVDQNGKVVSFNGRFIAMWNLPRELMSVRHDEQMLQAAASQVADEKAFVERVKYLYEHPDEMGREEIRLKDGRVFERHSGSLRDASGKYLGRIWFFRDISDRERAREALAKNEEKYRNLVESTTDFIWEIDRQGRYTYVSPTVKVLTGYEAQELIGKTPFDLMPPSEAERVASIFESAVAARQPFSTIENVNLRKDGTEVVLESSGVPIIDDNGGWQGYRGIDRDITERKLDAEKLQQRDSLLHATAIAATELVATASLDEAIPRTLKLVGETIQVDCINVFDRGPTAESAPIMRFTWHAADLDFEPDKKAFENPHFMTAELLAWQAPILEGKPLTAQLSAATGDLRKRMESIRVKSLLVVPILVNGQYWGQLGVEARKRERAWPAYEVEILRLLADLIGNAIQHDRYVKEIADANRIVQNTPTILYRMRGEPSLPMIYISQNIKLFGHEPAALVASPSLYQSLIHPDDIARVRDTMAATMEKGEPRGVNEFRLLNSHGEYRWVENRYTPIRDSANRLVEIEGLLFDVTERKAAEEKIARLARTDALTGLPNRSTFIERLQQTFAAARRGAPSFAVFYLDLDHFKDINDTLGHPIGDTMLRRVGECIKGVVRETDLVARFGGDEFAILQADMTDSSDAGSLAGKIQAALAVPIRLAGSEIRMTASIGIATYAPEVGKPEDMLAQADVALYRAKEEGRDQYRFHSEALDIEVRERVALAEELRRAIERDELELYYQPQVELSTGQIAGMEALIRWNHPTRGLLLPSAFVAVAEKTGSIAAIGRWVLDRSCRQMHLWREEGIAPPTLAVNISLTQISAANEFIQQVTETLSKWSLAATDLEFDVTESMLARATLAQNDVLERLHKLGVKIAIDDFGTKFSTLDYLKIYRVSRLKIPHALIAAAAKDPESAAIVRAIAGIARELNIDVVAQGVETEAQWSYLTATSPASKVQGFFYSEPVPAGRAQDLLKAGRIAGGERHRDAAAPGAGARRG